MEIILIVEILVIDVRAMIIVRERDCSRAGYVWPGVDIPIACEETVIFSSARILLLPPVQFEISRVPLPVLRVGLGI